MMILQTFFENTFFQLQRNWSKTEPLGSIKLKENFCVLETTLFRVRFQKTKLLTSYISKEVSRGRLIRFFVLILCYMYHAACACRVQLQSQSLEGEKLLGIPIELPFASTILENPEIFPPILVVQDDTLIFEVEKKTPFSMYSTIMQVIHVVSTSE